MHGSECVFFEACAAWTRARSFAGHAFCERIRELRREATNCTGLAAVLRKSVPPFGVTQRSGHLVRRVSPQKYGYSLATVAAQLQKRGCSANLLV